MKRLRLRSEARDELIRETLYYESKRPGTGKRFSEAVAASFDLIRRFPKGGAPGPAGTRKTKVKGFPFTVAYRDEPDAVIVFAIAPDRHQPGYWPTRVDGE